MTAPTLFKDLHLAPALLTAITDLGYETPTAVQAESIPSLLEGHDILAQAQTGTGKTGAFALPILSNLQLEIKEPQALVIAPTRELAIQVAEAFQSYAKHMKGFHVTPIYGGQSYQIQLRALKRGTNVIVGTPGRVMDHLRRGVLSVQSIKTVVLDEADEMLKMGFIDDIEWILEQIPHKHQTALFSATMSPTIQKIAKRYLKDAKKVHVKPNKTTVDTITQCYTRVSQHQKLDVLTRFLEVEDIQASIIFTRTKSSSAELAEKLKARGYAAAALNGDMNQALRERVIGQIKRGALDIIVATDVAARGIDVERVSHVINYDIPHDTESYIHRIGRTGRAGRKGTALLFVTPREGRMLNDIERAVNVRIKQIEPPSLNEMKEKRGKQLAEKVLGVLAKSKHLKPYQEIVENIIAEGNCEAKDIAAALVYLIQQSNPMPSNEIEAAEPEFESRPKRQRRRRPTSFKGNSSGDSDRKRKRFSGSSSEPSRKRKPAAAKSSAGSFGKGKPAKAKPSNAFKGKRKPTKAPAHSH